MAEVGAADPDRLTTAHGALTAGTIPVLTVVGIPAGAAAKAPVVGIPAGIPAGCPSATEII